MVPYLGIPVRRFIFRHTFWQEKKMTSRDDVQKSYLSGRWRDIMTTCFVAFLTLSEPQRPNQDSIWFDPNGQTRIPSGLTSTAEPGLIKFTVVLCSLRDVINQ